MKMFAFKNRDYNKVQLFLQQQSQFLSNSKVGVIIGRSGCLIHKTQRIASLLWLFPLLQLGLVTRSLWGTPKRDFNHNNNKNNLQSIWEVQQNQLFRLNLGRARLLNFSKENNKCTKSNWRVASSMERDIWSFLLSTHLSIAQIAIGMFELLLNIPSKVLPSFFSFFFCDSVIVLFLFHHLEVNLCCVKKEKSKNTVLLGQLCQAKRCFYPSLLQLLVASSSNHVVKILKTDTVFFCWQQQQILWVQEHNTNGAKVTTTKVQVKQVMLVCKLVALQQFQSTQQINKTQKYQIKKKHEWWHFVKQWKTEHITSCCDWRQHSKRWSNWNFDSSTSIENWKFVGNWNRVQSSCSFRCLVETKEAEWRSILLSVTNSECRTCENTKLSFEFPQKKKKKTKKKESQTRCFFFFFSCPFFVCFFFFPKRHGFVVRGQKVDIDVAPLSKHSLYGVFSSTWNLNKMERIEFHNRVLTSGFSFHLRFFFGIAHNTKPKKKQKHKTKKNKQNQKRSQKEKLITKKKGMINFWFWQDDVRFTLHGQTVESRAHIAFHPDSQNPHTLVLSIYEDFWVLNHSQLALKFKQSNHSIINRCFCFFFLFFFVWCGVCWVLFFVLVVFMLLCSQQNGLSVDNLVQTTGTNDRFLRPTTSCTQVSQNTLQSKLRKWGLILKINDDSLFSMTTVKKLCLCLVTQNQNNKKYHNSAHKLEIWWGCLFGFYRFSRSVFNGKWQTIWHKQTRQSWRRLGVGWGRVARGCWEWKNRWGWLAICS